MDAALFCLEGAGCLLSGKAERIKLMQVDAGSAFFIQRALVSLGLSYLQTDRLYTMC